jgi:RNA polymerase sigma factor (sigma-70 family)
MMAIGPGNDILREIHGLFAYGTVAGLSDQQLLERFASHRDEAAFTALVERHGAMVHRACRAILRDEHEAEDAFQAVFLLLARRAGRLWVRGSLGPWLHAVAWRVAVDARNAGVCRRRHERLAAAMASARSANGNPDAADQHAILHEEIGRLPALYRTAVVVCDLEGRTHEEAARLLGWPVGTVKSRQARARERLRDRLTRRGFAPSADRVGAAMVSEIAKAALPYRMIGSTARAAVRFVSSGGAIEAAAGPLSTRAIALVNRWEAMIFASSLKAVAAALMAVVVMSTGVGFLIGRVPASTPPSDPPKAMAMLVAPVDGDRDPLPAGAVARLGRRRLSHGAPVTAVAYHPDGTLVASAGGGLLKLWDSATGRLVREMRAHTNNSQTLAFSPDGRLLASGGDDWTIRIWDVATGRPTRLLHGYRYGGGGPVFPIQVAFTPDGKTLVFGCHDGVIMLWDVGTGRERSRLQPPQPRPKAGAGARVELYLLSALAISPDGRRLASADSLKCIHIWDLERGQLLRTIPSGWAWIPQSAFSPDGKTLAWAGPAPPPGKGAGIQFWDLAANRLAGTLPAERRTMIAYSRDGRRLASGGWDHAVKLWDLETSKLLQNMTGHTDYLDSVALSPDASTIVSGGNDGSVRLWDAGSGQERFGGPMAHWDVAMSVTIAPDGRTVLIGARDRIIRAVDLPSGELRRSFAFEGESPESLAFSPDGTRAAGARGATVTVYDVATGKRTWSKGEFRPRPELPEIDGIDTSRLVISGDGRRIVSTTFDLRNGQRQRATIRVWDSASGGLVSQIVRTGYVEAAPLFLDGGRTLVLAESGLNGGESVLGCYETETGVLLREHQAADLFVGASAAAPDGSWVAFGGGSRVQFWDAVGGRLLFTLTGPRYGVYLYPMAVSPDGSRIAAAESGSWGDLPGLVHIWRVADGRRTHELPAQATALAFTPDGRALVTCSGDGTALVWDLAATADPPAPPSHLNDAELEERWTALAHGHVYSLGNPGNFARIDAMAQGGDESVAFLRSRLLDPDLARKDEAEIDRLLASLTDPDPEVRARAAARFAAFGDFAEIALPQLTKGPDVVVREVRQRLRGLFRGRRDEVVYQVLRHIGTLHARALLHRLAEVLPANEENRLRKWNAGKTADELDRARLRLPAQ